MALSAWRADYDDVLIRAFGKVDEFLKVKERDGAQRFRVYCLRSGVGLKENVADPTLRVQGLNGVFFYVAVFMQMREILSHESMRIVRSRERRYKNIDFVA